MCLVNPDLHVEVASIRIAQDLRKALGVGRWRTQLRQA
jgi:hypothetical protein